MPETANQRRAREIRQSTYGKQVREPIAKSVEVTRDRMSNSLDKIEAFHNERVVRVTTAAISDRPDYYTLTFTRKNGQ